MQGTTDRGDRETVDAPFGNNRPQTVSPGGPIRRQKASAGPS